MFEPPILQGRLDSLACEDSQSGAAFLHAELPTHVHQALEINNLYTVKGPISPRAPLNFSPVCICLIMIMYETNINPQISFLAKISGILAVVLEKHIQFSNLIWGDSQASNLWLRYDWVD